MGKVTTFKPGTKISHVSKPTGMKAPKLHYAKPMAAKAAKLPKLPKPKMGTRTKMSKIKL